MAVENNLYEVRKSRGLRQIDLAQQVGISDRTLRRWENGESTPRLAIAIRLSEIMNVSVNDLFRIKETSL